METILLTTILLITCGVITGDWDSQRKYDRSRGEFILRKGGISEQIKRFNAFYIIGSIYIAPEVRNNITIKTVQDLYSYTICEKETRELFANLSSKTYKYSVCPDEFPETVNFASIKEYCCRGITVYCCNVSEFRGRRVPRVKFSFSFGTLFSIICPLIFFLMVVVAVKAMCGSRIRTRWNNIHIITRRGPPESPNYYQQNMPLMYPPNNQQYPMNIYGNPAVPPNVGGQYPNPQATPGQYPYGVQPVPGQYPYGPQQGPGNIPYSQAPYGQSPPGAPMPQGPLPPTGQHAYMATDMPPPDYQKAILQ